MATNMKEFLYNYFALRNMQSMSDGVLNHLNDLIQKNEYPNDTVKSWKDKFLEAADPQKPDGPKKVKGKDKLPDIKSLSADEFEELYRSFYDVFYSMSQNIDNYLGEGNAKTREFIENYFGKDKVFEPTPVQAKTKDEIKRFVDLLLSNTDALAVSGIEREELSMLRSIQKDPSNIDNPKSRNLLFRLIRSISRDIQFGNVSKNIVDLFADVGLDDILNELNKPENVTPEKLQLFENNYVKIFETLYSKDNIYAAFKENEGNDKTISRQIDTALSDTDYTGKINSKNYIAPKYKEDLNLRQTIDKKLDNTYKNVLKKYLTLHRDNLFIKPEAKAIFEALDKEKIKPTDGINKILEKANDITNRLKGKEPFNAAKHFEWMVNILKSLKDNGKEKTLEAALRNPRQLRSIIEEIVIEALSGKDKKVKEAKTAMEVLSVMQYGLFTSRTMDAINKTDMNIFSDDKLSWNKNEGNQMLTKVTDRALQAGLQLGGYALTAAINGSRRIGSSLRNSDRLNTQSETRKKELEKEKNDWQSTKQKEDIADNKTISDNDIRIQNSGIKDDTELSNAKAKLKADRVTEESNKQAFKNAEQNFAQWEQYRSDYERLMQISVERVNISREIGRLKAELQAMPNPAPDQQAELEAQTKKQESLKIQKQLDNLEKESDELKSRYPGIRTDKTTGKTTIIPYNKFMYRKDTYGNAKTRRDKAEQAYTNSKNANDDLDKRIYDYEDGNEQKKAAQDRLDKRADKDKKWDNDNKNEYMELMAYWDFLQSGKTKTKLFHFATNKVQDKMDKGKMQAMLNNWNNSYAA